MSEKYIAFVFDDGPRAPMDEMVDKFVQYGGKASFAIVGNKISDDTESMLRYAVDNGCQLASHSQMHVRLDRMENTETMKAEMLQPIAEVQRRIGYTMTMARLPGHCFNDTVLTAIAELGLPLLGIDNDCAEDWKSTSSPERIAAAVLRTVRDGSIVTLHVTRNTCDALDIILPELQRQGYCFVTGEGLFAAKGIKDIPLGINIRNVNLL